MPALEHTTSVDIQNRAVESHASAVSAFFFFFTVSLLEGGEQRYIKAISNTDNDIVQELCESWGGRPGLSVLTSLMVSVDVKQYWTILRHWSQLVPSMSTDRHPRTLSNTTEPNRTDNCNHRVPSEIKRREVELDPQISPEEIMSREVELGCKSWTSFASGCSLTAVQRTLSLWLPQHGSWNSNCAVYLSLCNGKGTSP